MSWQERHTQTCPTCGARDEESKVNDGKDGAEDLRGVHYTGYEPGDGHAWMCCECGKYWWTIEGFVREPVKGVAA